MHAIQCRIDVLRSIATLLREHARRVMLAADTHADDACRTQTRERRRDKSAVLIARRRRVEEVACLHEEARMLRDGIVNRSREACAQTFAALGSPLRREARQVCREMIVA